MKEKKQLYDIFKISHKPSQRRNFSRENPDVEKRFFPDFHDFPDNFHLMR